MSQKIIFLLRQSLQCIQDGDLRLAEEYAKKALDIDSRNFNSLNILGSIKGMQGKISESVDLLLMAAEIKENDFGTQFNLARGYMDLGRYAESLPHHRKALSINSNSPDALVNYAKSLHELGDDVDAIAAYDKALELKPEDCEIWTYKGLLLNELQDTQGALTALNKALTINPRYSPAIFGVGVAHYDLRKYQEAIYFYEKALEIDTNNAAIWCNKGLAHHDLGQYKDALSSYKSSLKHQPNYFDAEFGEALTRLTLGDLKEGLKKFEARWIKTNPPPYRHAQFSKLADLNTATGKTILVWEEEGFGDAIQFSRYIPKLLELKAKIIFEVRPELLRLFECFDGVSFIQRGDNVLDVDYQIPLQSLPLIFEASLLNIPSTDGYLSISDALVENWATRLALKNEKLNIGVATSINSKYAQLPGHKRAMPIKELEPLLEHANLYIIQKDLPEDDRSFIANKFGITYLGDELKDFSDSAAIIKNMDLVVCVDTSLAHLAGAIGKRVFILLSHTADWRWFLDTTLSPWYSSARLFRQRTSDDWSQVVEDVIKSLPNTKGS